jgi:hypothetical protein
MEASRSRRSTHLQCGNDDETRHGATMTTVAKRTQYGSDVTWMHVPSQWHVPAVHVPCPEQFIGQTTMLQSSPPNRELHDIDTILDATSRNNTWQ